MKQRKMEGLTGRLIILEVSYFKQGDKYYKISVNSSGTEYFKQEIDPHGELFEEDYWGDVIDLKEDINDDDVVISAVGIKNIAKIDEHDPRVLYKETFEGKTRALLTSGIAC